MKIGRAAEPAELMLLSRQGFLYNGRLPVSQEAGQGGRPETETHLLFYTWSEIGVCFASSTCPKKNCSKSCIKLLLGRKPGPTSNNGFRLKNRNSRSTRSSKAASSTSPEMTWLLM